MPQRSTHSTKDETGRASVTLEGVVEKVIPSPHPAIPEKAQVAVERADHTYRELRIENTLEDETGKKVKLKPGAEVDVIIEADPSGITSKDGN
jgi:hypothetical protein